MLLRIFFFFYIFLISNIAHADLNSNICMRYAERYAASLSIPKYTLAAISSVESGRNKSKSGKYNNPWPWTINYGGHGEHFATRTAAIKRVKALLNKGVESIDVGCMQVNLKYHPNAFKTLKDAFNPRTNIKYAGEFLASLYAKGGSWKDAIAHYHSRTDSRGTPYYHRVKNTINAIQGKTKKKT
jgi:soluble lytic murein transglycosylase-like protein